MYNIYSETILFSEYEKDKKTLWLAVLILLYNMVNVAVAFVISTMHEKSCIDLHNAWKFEKGSKIRSFAYLSITMMKLRK